MISWKFDPFENRRYAQKMYKDYIGGEITEDELIDACQINPGLGGEFTCVDVLSNWAEKSNKFWQDRQECEYCGNTKRDKYGRCIGCGHS